MELPVDERLLTEQFYLIKQRGLAVARKRQLLEQFRAFALNKLKTYGQPFQVKFRSINGNPNLKYQDLDMNDTFFLEYGSFTFNPKTNLLSDYVRTEFRETKTKDDFDELIKTSTKKPRIIRKTQQILNLATDMEREKIRKLLQKRVDKILMGIFEGKLSFNDPEFKRLVATNIALEQELQTLNARIGALDIINGSANIHMAGNNLVPIEEDSEFKKSK